MKKVLLAIPDTGKSPSWGYRLRYALESLGHDVSVFNFRNHQMHRFSLTNKLLNKQLLNKAKSLNPDLVLGLNCESILPGIIDKISDSGIETVNWYWDDPFGEYVKKEFNILNRNEYDYFFVFDEFYVKKLKETGQDKSYYLPVGADPNLYHEEIKVEKRAYKADISFMGTYYPERENLLNNLKQHKLKIWGYGWDKKTTGNALNKFVQKDVYDTRKRKKDVAKVATLFNQSKINLNVHHNQAKKGGLNLRYFEIPSTNSFQLSDHVKGVEKLFRKDERACYNNIEEMTELAEYYLDNKEERDKLALKSHKRIIKEHTFRHRIEHLMKKVK